MIWTIFTEVRVKNLGKIVQNAKEVIQFAEIPKIVKTFKLLQVCSRTLRLKMEFSLVRIFPYLD